MGFLDFILARTRRSAPATQSTGVSGSAAFGGKLVNHEKRPELQDRNLYLTLNNVIANTAIVGTGVRYYQNLIGGTSWSVEPKEDTGAVGQKAADLVKSGLFEASMPDQWSTCVKRASLYRMYGFSTHEWVMRRRATDGAMVFSSIEHRPQSTVEYWDVPDVGGQVRGIVQRPVNWGDYYYVPRSRLWYVVDNSLTDSPDGVGLLRHVVEHSRRLGRYEQLEGYAYETDMRGIPVAKIPYRTLEKFATDNKLGPGWVAAQTAPTESFVKNHVRTAWQSLAIDSSIYSFDGQNGSTVATNTPQWAVELLKGDGVGLAEVHQVIERINREIARCLGMEFLLLGGDGKGSLALSRDKTSMFASNLEAALHELSWTVVHDLVYPLLELNGIDPEKYAPQVMPDPIATERIETTVDALWKLAQAGAVLMPDDPAVDQIRRRLHLVEQPDIPPEVMSAMLPRAKTPGAPGQTGGGQEKPAESANAKPEKPAATENAPKPTKESKSTFRVRDEDRTMVPLESAAIEWAGGIVVDWGLVDAITDLITKSIKRVNGKYHVYSQDGSEHLGGPYDTRAQAISRLRQVEGHKEDK